MLNFTTFMIFSILSLQAIASEKEMQFGSTPFPDAKPKMNARSCSNVDLSDKMGPVHNQTGGTCYAYTALDILNFGTSERYSPLHLASQLKFTPPDPNAPRCPNVPLNKLGPLDWVGGFNGGFIDQTLKLGMKTGLCPEQLFKATDGVVKKDYQKLVEYYQNLVKSKGASPEECYVDGVASFPEDVRKKLEEGQGLGWKSSAVKDELRRAFPLITQEKASEIAAKSKSADELIKGLGNEACSAYLRKGLPPGKSEKHVVSIDYLITRDCKKYFKDGERNKMVELINDALDKNKPAGLSYVTGGLIQQPAPASHGYHASVVSGRSWDESKKECNYLIKNSWGEDWKVPAGLKAKSAKDHPGYFVVTEKQLLEHIYGATTID